MTRSTPPRACNRALLAGQTPNQRACTDGAGSTRDPSHHRNAPAEDDRAPGRSVPTRGPNRSRSSSRPRTDRRSRLDTDLATILPTWGAGVQAHDRRADENKHVIDVETLTDDPRPNRSFGSPNHVKAAIGDDARVTPVYRAPRSSRAPTRRGSSPEAPARATRRRSSSSPKPCASAQSARARRRRTPPTPSSSTRRTRVRRTSTCARRPQRRMPTTATLDETDGLESRPAEQHTREPGNASACAHQTLDSRRDAQGPARSRTRRARTGASGEIRRRNAAHDRGAAKRHAAPGPLSTRAHARRYAADPTPLYRRDASHAPGPSQHRPRTKAVTSQHAPRSRQSSQSSGASPRSTTCAPNPSQPSSSAPSHSTPNSAPSPSVESEARASSRYRSRSSPRAGAPGRTRCTGGAGTPATAGPRGRTRQRGGRGNRALLRNATQGRNDDAAHRLRTGVRRRAIHRRDADLVCPRRTRHSDGLGALINRDLHRDRPAPLRSRKSARASSRTSTGTPPGCEPHACSAPHPRTASARRCA